MLRYAGILATLIGLTLHILTGCVAKLKLADIEVKDFSKYKMYQEKEGVRVAVDPYLEEERLKEFFGADLLIAYGLLPVHIVVENGTNQPLLVQKTDIILLTSDNNAIMPEILAYAKMPIEMKRLEAERAVDMWLVLGLLPAIAAATIIGPIPDYEKMMYNISAKALNDRSLYKGEKNHGFVYFRIADKVSKGTALKVLVKLKNPKTEDISSFIFNVDFGNIRRKTATGE